MYILLFRQLGGSNPGSGAVVVQKTVYMVCAWPLMAQFFFYKIEYMSEQNILVGHRVYYSSKFQFTSIIYIP